MKHYVITIEQIHNENGSVSEYATKSDSMTEKAATSAFYKKCGAVNDDLSPQGHSYMHIEMINSKGFTKLHADLGDYIDQ